MSKLYFKYGAMNCGKSTALLQAAHNYEEKGKKVILIKSSIDTKANSKIQSRIGIEREVNLLIKPKESFEDYYESWNKNNVSCILVDEAQFLTTKQVEELWIFVKMYNIPAMCYGLRTNFQTELFEGSKRLLELSDEQEELVTICDCGKKAKFNARYVDGKFTTIGESVLIDGAFSNVEHRPMCGKCYVLNKYGDINAHHNK